MVYSLTDVLMDVTDAGSMRNTLTLRVVFCCGKMGAKTAVILSKMWEPKSNRCFGDHANRMTGLINTNQTAMQNKTISKAFVVV